jgi:lipoprotein-anchoring transpeptidase ErfK/SrfK
MRFFYGSIFAAAQATVAAFVFCSSAVAASQGNPAQPVQKSRQTPATELIKKQAKPRVVPRVLDKVTPDNARIYISLGKQRAFLMVGDEIAIDTPISSGKRAGMTPTGSYSVMEKDKDHRSSVYGAFVNSRNEIVRGGVSTKIDSAPSGTRFKGAPMLWFLRLTTDGVGMHVGILPGYPASHGCVRLPADIAPLFYNHVKVGTPVQIDA